ncbi:MAG: cupin domain-containing protein [Planctomycetales bacterium]|nr:cupin domain-containing protein [Planctomycetales bacterium]
MNRPAIGVILAGIALLVAPLGCRPAPVAAETDVSSPQVTVLIKETCSWDGATLPEYPAGQPEVTVLRILIPPGTRLETHHHTVINAGVLLSGKLKVISEDGKTLDLHAGDSLIELVNEPHYGVNNGSEPAEIIVFYAGVAGEPITVIDHEQSHKHD